VAEMQREDFALPFLKGYRNNRMDTIKETGSTREPNNWWYLYHNYYDKERDKENL
jgi:hypothetical protein